MHLPLGIAGHGIAAAAPVNAAAALGLDLERPECPTGARPRAS
ncbi:hypothetical protein ACFC1R_24755 [Kitasatospora sp. NPDC056138]